MSVIGPWNETCQPPWNEKELRKKLRDAAGRTGRQQTIRSRSDDGKGDEAERENEIIELPATREAPDDPHRLAQLFLRDGNDERDQPVVRCWNGDWYKWDGVAFRPIADAEV